MRKQKLRLVVILGILCIVASSLFSFIRGLYVAPIIMYHSVNPQAKPINRLAVTDKTFDKQMRFLKNRHYNVLPLEELSKLIKEKKKIPPRTIAITLDDGYKDNYQYAFPILKKYNLPATMFIIIDEVGRYQNDRLSWDEIRQMQASGLINFGSHCLGPEPLINIKSDTEVKRQIFDSKQILEEKLAKPVNAFSYPEGFFTPKIRQWVIGAGYQAAVATMPGKKFSSHDPFALKRLRISSNADNLFVFWVETSGYYTAMREFQRQHKRKKR